MKTGLPRTVVAGILGGTLAGILTGAYVVVLTQDHVIRRDDYSHAVGFEQSQARYGATVLLAFAIVFAAIGPFVASAPFGPWIRHAVYGLVSSVGLVVLLALICAAVTNQQPFNRYKGSQSSCIAFARTYAVPLAIVVGPALGVIVGKNCRRS